MPPPQPRPLAMFAVLATAWLLFACGGPPDPPRLVAPHRDPRTFRLANGLVVLLDPDATAREAHVRVRYHAGSKDDPPSLGGLAHLAEHLMFREISRTAPRDFHQAFDAYGSLSANATTTWDSTDFFETTAQESLEPILWLEAARMATPLELVDAAALARERDVVVNELHERRDDMPLGSLYDVLSSAIFDALHPYRHPIGGTVETLRLIDVTALRRFAERFYRPNRATLIVTGRFDPEAAHSAIVRFFGRIPPGDESPPATFRVPALSGSDVTLEMRAAVETPTVVLAWPGPPASDPALPIVELGIEGLRRRVARTFLSAGPVHVDAGLVHGRLASLAVVAYQVQKTIGIADAVGILDRVCKGMSSLGTAFNPWFDFPNVKTHHDVAMLSSTESLPGRARRLADDLEYRGVTDGIEQELAAIERVAPDVVIRMLTKTYLDRPKVIVIVMPDASAPPMGVVHGRGPR